MMFPKEGKFVCSCGETEDIGGRSEVIVTESRDKETVILSSDSPATLPKVRVLCPKCGHTEAYYVIRQTRAADEPETTIYRCCKCSYSWREY
ncbi:MAG: transcription factor S [Candidatus Methanomethylophilaceae archaeon]|nr:transcription factor S [Candidatus Methanomethylophilaceae archaeon]